MNIPFNDLITSIKTINELRSEVEQVQSTDLVTIKEEDRAASLHAIDLVSDLLTMSL